MDMFEVVQGLKRQMQNVERSAADIARIGNVELHLLSDEKQLAKLKEMVLAQNVLIGCYVDLTSALSEVVCKLSGTQPNTGGAVA